MFELPKLEYEYNALEPYIDEETMRIHHSKHHSTYTDNFNKAVGETNKSAEEIIKENKIDAIRNNGGGYINHKLFFSILKKDVEFKGEVAEAIKKKFGSYEKFKEEFSKAAMTQFGSGWAFLVVNNEELEIVKKNNQDSPISDGMKPILCIDVWEHSFYLKWKNEKGKYVENFFKVINWDKVNELYLKT